MTRPFFTIITCNYNTELFLEECLNSVKGQSFQDYQHLIINDYSPNKYKGDNCQTTFNKIYNQDTKAKFIDLESNLGVSGARNIGLDNAQGQFILFLDADDYYLPDHLKNLQIELLKYPDLWNSSIFSLKDGFPFKTTTNGQVEILKKPMIEQRPKHSTLKTELVFFSTTMPLLVFSKAVIGDIEPV
jgi:glycosyltransferase involved in cell wall biosynthesis